MKLIKIPQINYRAVLAVLVSVVCLTMILTQVDSVALLQAIRGIRTSGLLLSIVLAMTIPVFCALRWRSVLNGLGTDMKFSQAYAGVMSAWVGNAVLPSKGGDFAKALIFGKSKSRMILVLSVVTERLIDIIILSLMAMLGALYTGWFLLATFIGFGLLVFLIILFINASHGMPRFIKKYIPAKYTSKIEAINFTRNKKYLIQAVISSCIVWLGAVAIFYLLMTSLGERIAFTRLVGLIPLALFVGMIPISISGIGTRDGMLIYLISDFASKESIVASGILYTALTYWLPALAGIPFLVSLLKTNKHHKL